MATEEEVTALVERVQALQARSHQVAGMGAALEHGLELMVASNLELEEEARGIVRDAKALGHNPALEQMSADALLVRVAADALNAHRGQLDPKAKRTLEGLQELVRKTAT